MIVRVLRECECTFSFWYDRHVFDRWKDDAWEKEERRETLTVGQIIEAIAVRASDNNNSLCSIDLMFMDDMLNCYKDVPCDCISITKE